MILTLSYPSSVVESTIEIITYDYSGYTQGFENPGYTLGFES